MTTSTRQTVAEIVRDRIPEGWFTDAPDVSVDDDEVLVVGSLGGVDANDESAHAKRIKQFREETREARIEIARELEHTFGRHVSWGARSGDYHAVFTNVATPVMTRLRFDERRVLDTLIAGGVARSRSEALAWCVRLVADKEREWLADLTDALKKVQEVRGTGPRG